MKLQRYSLHDVDIMDFILMHGAILCKDDDVEALEAENAALHAECDRLTAMLCKVPTKEAEAAYDQIDRYLRNNLDDSEYADMSAALEHCYRTLLYPQKVLSAEEVTQPGLYAWRKGEKKLLWWVLVEFADIYNPGKGDVESVLCRRSFQNGQKVRVVGCASPGQFIGPIKMPEVQDA